MTGDLELHKEVWKGCVVACFSLASHEITGTGKPNALYLMLQRNSYLPLINDKIHKHFSTFVDASEGSAIWFDHGGVPLRWHYPIGVLFDIIHGRYAEVPLDITVHFRDFPEDTIMRFDRPETVEAHFMSMLKEADHLKHRGQVINSMNKTQHKQLWHSLRNDQFDHFWAINCKLMEMPDGTASFKYVPIRVYYQDSVIQKLACPVAESKESQMVSLRDYLATIFKQHFPDDDIDQLDMIVHGIPGEYDSTLQWLSENLSYADNFLHVVLKKSQ